VSTIGPAEHEINKRAERKDRLFLIVKTFPGSTRKEVKGKFTRAYSVKKTTFYEYVEDLIDEGRVVEEERFAQPAFLWAREHWDVEYERRQKEEALTEEKRVETTTLEAFQTTTA